MDTKSDRQEENELMETEDQVLKEMQEEFRKRLQSRLQDRVEAKEHGLCETHGLKKKTCRAAPDKHLRADRAPRD
jgi:hypothetical protein